MKKRKIRMLADTIEKHAKKKQGIFNSANNRNRVGFNMSNFFTEKGNFKDHVDNCNTVACIAGWALLMENINPYIPNSSIFIEAATILGLNDEIADQLFYPSIDEPYNAITTKRAVRVLRELADTGKVNW